jgi:hypothetical protein
VLQDVDEVIAGHGVAPEPVLDPEGRVQERVVLLGGAEVRPDPREPAQRTKIRPRQVRVVVPLELARGRGQVGEEDRGQESADDPPPVVAR